MEKIKVIFILGSGHCGSTLLDMLLGTHPDVFGGGEIEHIHSGEMQECACGKDVSVCDAWGGALNAVMHKVRAGRTKLDAIRKRFSFYNSYGDFDVDTYRNESVAVYERLCEANGVSIIVDSSKNPDRVRALVDDPRINAYVIHLVRGGQANTWSYIRKYKKFFPFFFWWVLTNLKIELLKYEVSVPWKYIYYNRFVKNPKQVMHEIALWAGIDGVFRVNDFRSAVHHQIAGNRMRKGGSNEIKPDTKWKKEMPYWQRILFIILFWWLDVYYLVRS